MIFGFGASGISVRVLLAGAEDVALNACRSALDEGPEVERILSGDRERTYGHPIHYLETFADPNRFCGTCYRAANWISLGLTTVRGNNAPTMERRPVKEILGYPLTPRFRQRLCGMDLACRPDNAPPPPILGRPGRLRRLGGRTWWRNNL